MPPNEAAEAKQSSEQEEEALYWFPFTGLLSFAHGLVLTHELHRVADQVVDVQGRGLAVEVHVQQAAAGRVQVLAGKQSSCLQQDSGRDVSCVSLLLGARSPRHDVTCVLEVAVDLLRRPKVGRRRLQFVVDGVALRHAAARLGNRLGQSIRCRQL